MSHSRQAFSSRRRFLRALAGAPLIAYPGISAGGQTGPTLDVVAFGADPSGTMDSADAVQQAIDQLPASGGTIVFPPGDYLMRPKPAAFEDHYNRWPREHASFVAVELRRSHTTFLGPSARLVLDQPVSNGSFSGMAWHARGAEFWAEGPFPDRTSSATARKPWRVVRSGTSLSEDPLVCLPAERWVFDSGRWRLPLTAGAHASLLPDGPADLFRGDVTLVRAGSLPAPGEWFFDGTAHQLWVADDPTTEDVEARPFADTATWSWDPLAHRVYVAQPATEILVDDAINFIFANRLSEGLQSLRFEGLTFDPNFAFTDRTNHRCALFVGCANVELVDCRLGNFGPTDKGGYSLDFMDCHDVLVQRCLLKKSSGGAAFVYCSHIRIEETTFENVLECLDFDKPNQDIHITDCIVDESPGTDFSIESNASRDLVITSLTARNLGRTINFSGKITWPDFGSLVAGSANQTFIPGVGFELTNSVIEDADQGSDCIAIGDRWDPPRCSPGSGHPGIEPTRDVVIEGNTFRRTSRVRIKEGLTVRIAGNRFEDCIASPGESASAPNGIVFAETENRVSFWPTASRWSRLDLDVRDNVFERCDKSAIAAERAERLWIENNRITGFSLAAPAVHHAVRLNQLDWASGQKKLFGNVIDGEGNGAGGVYIHTGNPSDEELSVKHNGFSRLGNDVPFDPRGFGYEIVRGEESKSAWHDVGDVVTAEWIALEESVDVQLVDVEVVTQKAIDGQAGDSLLVTLVRRNVATGTETVLLDLELSPPVLAKGSSVSLGRERIFSDPLGVARGPVAFVVRIQRSSTLPVGKLRTLSTFVTV